MTFGSESAHLRLSTFVWFSTIPMVSAITPLLILPVIAACFGSDGWAAVAMGQSVGAAAAVIVELGWGLTGPQLVARATSSQRAALARVALRAKLIASLMVMPVAVLIAAFIGPGDPLVKALTAAATVLGAWSISWYFLGTGKPVGILLTETLPRVCATAISAACLLSGGALIWYPIIVGFANSSAALTSTYVVCRSQPAERLTLHFVLDSIRSQFVAVGARAVSALYIALPVALVGVVAPGSVPTFAAVDRVLRLGLQVAQSIPNAMQSWVGGVRSMSGAQHRIRFAVRMNSALGFLGMVSFWALGSWVVDLLFRGTIKPSMPLILAAGMIVLVTMVSRAIGSLALVRLRALEWILGSAVMATIVGVPSVLLGGYYWAATGAMAAVLLAEVVALCVQAVGLKSRWGAEYPDSAVDRRWAD